MVASIDQAGYTIRAEVPFTANVTELKPTITYIGKAITVPGGDDKTADPLTDTGRDFTTAQTYTVKDQSGAGQPYAVTVIRKSSVDVSFTGEAENGIILRSSFNRTTGFIEVAIDTTRAAAPYEWYLDGVRQPVSNTQDVFTLHAGDGTLIPGRHEIMVSGMIGGLHYTGKMYFVVSGDTK